MENDRFSSTTPSNSSLGRAELALKCRKHRRSPNVEATIEVHPGLLPEVMVRGHAHSNDGNDPKQPAD